MFETEPLRNRARPVSEFFQEANAETEPLELSETETGNWASLLKLYWTNEKLFSQVNEPSEQKTGIAWTVQTKNVHSYWRSQVLGFFYH